MWGPPGQLQQRGSFFSPMYAPSRLNVYDPVLRQFFPERLVVTSAMVPVQLWIIEHWFRWRCSRSKMPERFIILLEQGIDERDQASNHMTNGLYSSFVGLRSLIVGAKPRDKALVQAGPFRLSLDRVPRH